MPGPLPPIADALPVRPVRTRTGRGPDAAPAATGLSTLELAAHLRRHGFLTPEGQSDLARTAGCLVLDARFQSTVPGLCGARAHCRAAGEHAGLSGHQVAESD
ncbi:hypothetical protein GCM10011578_099480 [Streptomyces fuscichromogenes]|uniref:Uncharacterized protein n=1 Tax=Streptomyces fuscichromogenes TaxID=1324013 RepID=A0A917XPF4_9ACTN|nr:hypothetical protein GCM10011578_099480 [Streptomyces fuscichromogenes]